MTISAYKETIPSHPSITREQALMILNGLPHMGPILLRRLLDAFHHDPIRLLQAHKDEWLQVKGVGTALAESLLSWKNHFDLEREERILKLKSCTFLSCEDPHYSPLLKTLYDHPIGLYCYGDYRPTKRSIAIIGSRRCTLYGQNVARQLARDLCRLEFCVVSGMARGIDTAAHEGALEAGGKTAAILGCGLDIIYPPENEKIYHAIRESGVVMSEFRMGRRADKQTFPMRNRIISGMSQALIVVESDENGGSMITARFAGEQGRQVFAVPGRIDQPSSRGCLQLIREGAILLRNIDDLLQEIEYLGQMEFDLDKKEAHIDDLGLNEDEKKVFLWLQQEGPSVADLIAEKTELPIADIHSNLLMLELKRSVIKRADGYFEAKH